MICYIIETFKALQILYITFALSLKFVRSQGGRVFAVHVKDLVDPWHPRWSPQYRQKWALSSEPGIILELYWAWSKTKKKKRTKKRSLSVLIWCQVPLFKISWKSFPVGAAFTSLSLFSFNLPLISENRIFLIWKTNLFPVF